MKPIKKLNLSTEESTVLTLTFHYIEKIPSASSLASQALRNALHGRQESQRESQPITRHWFSRWIWQRRTLLSRTLIYPRSGRSFLVRRKSFYSLTLPSRFSKWKIMLI